MRKTAYIYAGGEIFADGIVERPEEGDLVIAADSGYNNAAALGISVNILLGDMDSIGEKFNFDALPSSVEIVKLPPEKDDTDTALALKLALDERCDNIVIIGGLSGRLDHTLSNLSLLEHLNDAGGKIKKIHALITDGKNRVRFIRDDSALIPRSHFKYLSLAPADAVCKGVTLKGCKYTLKNAKIYRDNCQHTASNEIEGNLALVEVRRGGLYIIESM